MNTLHLKYVAEVAKTGSITQAAENLFMAQPNLSKAIKELEETLGISIFRRTSKGVVLTEKGEEFLVYAKRILTQIGRMEALAGGENRREARMSLCVPQGTYISYALAGFIAECSGENELEVKVKEADFAQGAALVCEGEVAFGILRVPTQYLQYFQGFLADKELRFQSLWEWEACLIMNATNALAGVAEITKNRLLDFVEFSLEEPVLPTLPGAEGALGKKEGRTVTVQGGEFLLSLLSQISNGYSWSSPLPAELLSRYGLVQRSCADGAGRFCDLLVYPKDYTLTPMDRKFIDALSVTKNQVAFGNF